MPVNDEKEVTIIATSSQIKLKINEITLQSKNTLGTQGIKKENQNIPLRKIINSKMNKVREKEITRNSKTTGM